MTAYSAPPRRFLHLWLDRLPTDRLQRRAPPAPSLLALTVRQGNAVRLHALTREAQAAGLSAGMMLSDAKAQIPELKTCEADPPADLAFLERLAEACRRYTPALAVEPPDGVCLNITGCERLFGGEAGLVEDLASRLEGLRLSFRAGVADTPLLARALARYAPRPFAAPGEGMEALAPLPVAALDLHPTALDTLRGLGLRRVGQLLDTPRGPLAKRIGTAAIDGMDEALGLRACAMALKLEIPPWYAEARLAEPVVAEDQVLRVAQDLAVRLCERLDGEGLGGRLFALELFRVDGAVRRLEVGASRPLRTPQRIAALFAERIAALNEGLEADFGFEQARLWACTTELLAARSEDLLDAPGAAGAFAVLADRLSARLGAGAVKALVPAPETRLPEQAVRSQPFVAEAPAAWAGEPRAVDEGTPLRPLTLFAPPQPIEVTAEIPEGAPQQFRWRRLSRRIVAAEGPERLEPEWARATEARRVRDYYRLEDEGGRRYWVFREGLYGEPADVRWYLHGLFP